MGRPHIGITTSFNEGEQRLDLRYIQAVERAGGLPMIVPMLEDQKAATQFAGMLAGLVVTGGPAVEDGLVGQLPDDISPTDPIRTASDKRILQLFLTAHRPVLGICYGMQLCNALRGGHIYADVEAQMEGAEAHSQKRGGATHTVHIDQDSLLKTILLTDSLDVNTRHIQAIKTTGDGLHVAATAPDGVIEAIESTDGSFVGVQFHPERMDETGDALFSYLIKRASRN